MSDPSEEQLLAAVKDSLEKDGRLGRFKAELRAAVISLLSRRTVEGTPPDVPPETKLVNELFREYLIWNGYTYTEQLLVAESSSTNERYSRENLSAKLGVIDDAHTSKIPLIYYVVSAFQNTD